MTKRYQDKRGVSVEEHEMAHPNRREIYKTLKLSEGIIHFSRTVLPVGEVASNDPKRLADIPICLEWQLLEELQVDHGLSASFEVLTDAGFIQTGGKTAPELIKEIKAAVTDEVWSFIERRLSELDDEKDKSGRRLVFLVAFWAGLFAEAFGEVWLAAMAEHAYFIEEDDFASGYLFALLDQKREIETDFLRGKKNIESAKMGGKARSTRLKPKTDRTLAEIQRLSEQGHSVTRSAELAFKNGIGTSPAANKRLWHRHSKK